MSSLELSCFKAYDVRGEIGIDLNEDIMYRVGRAAAEHMHAKKTIVGYDSRETSENYASEVAKGLCDAGSNVLMIGMAGTEEMYWAVSEFSACLGIEITASHNPINYNGAKIVKSGSKPLDFIKDFSYIKRIAEIGDWLAPSNKGTQLDVAIEARAKYVKRIVSFIDTASFKPMKVVINCGNGTAGPTLDAIIESLNRSGVPINFICINHNPDPGFPNGVPNPMLPENHAATSDIVKQTGADLGIAFDGDFDRCFFFDEHGNFVPGEFVVGIFVSMFLEREKGAKIVYDPRVIWNILEISKKKGGIAVQSETGHSNFKNAMRNSRAIYGGEVSAHHYFRDFAFCDSGMIPWLLLIEYMSKEKVSLGEILKSRQLIYTSSGEINLKVNDADEIIESVHEQFRNHGDIDLTDGISISFIDWRFNLRKSNTEPLLRLNVETYNNASKLKEYVKTMLDVIENYKNSSINVQDKKK